MIMTTDNDPALYFAEDGNPRSGRFGDIYYSLDGGLAETEAVFFQGCHLPQSWHERSRFRLLELGFGTGLNIAALMRLWAETRQTGAILHIFSIEAYLMDRDAAQKALAAFPAIKPFSDAILAQWPKARQGLHYMDFPQWGISLTLGLMDVRPALRAYDGQADAVFLDGFSPALNPDMWAGDVLGLVAQKCAATARIATFTVAGAVRRALADHGFTVEKKAGFGKKRERLEAFRQSDLRHSKPVQNIAIGGAGIAGATMARLAKNYGLNVTFFDPNGMTFGASGNRAGLMTPRLDASGGNLSQFFADSFFYAADFYNKMAPQGLYKTGVLWAKDDESPARLDAILAQAFWPEGAIERHDEGLFFKDGLCFSPETVVKTLLADFEIINAPIEDAKDYDAVIYTDGAMAIKRWPELNLRPVRGQIEMTESDTPPNPTSWGGYVAPFDGGFAFGSSHVRDDWGLDIRESERQANVETLGQKFPNIKQRLDPSRLQSRASLRVMSRDYMPVVGQIAPQAWVINGLGSRGFCVAPLLAKLTLERILFDADGNLSWPYDRLNLARFTRGKP